MASTDHLAVSTFIKSVHQTLRDASKEVGVEEAWRRHCSDEGNLTRYAGAMRELACNFWESSVESTANSRIEWTVNACENYFTKDVTKYRSKEREIALRINCTFNLDATEMVPVPKLKLLDVGSCYNPFSKYEQFEVTAIDIAPAKDEVYKCDFLSVKVAESTTVIDNEVLELPKGYFQVIVFSLLLEYLPSPSQRLYCCRKAYELLKTEGLLVIITPDSNHVGSNAKYMKSWRYVLAGIGFSRIKYEKLPHVHCMAFRKTVSKAVACRWAELHEGEGLFEEIYIPQDFRKGTINVNKSEKGIKTCKEGVASVQNDGTGVKLVENFCELPGFV
ncbi:hypothetical protein NQ315_002363 [Exocentrus adspersus]|uniref:S-adenosylmethionine sensor upstream of mTORC1 n=1 Tax=Exocentrus adspersus TaxID=1586481 RepID=A0AAV8VSJ0_9CUCU|nr:hypothetical protein NQ315_002363 [Exocentrus adspersus]